MMPSSCRSLGGAVELNAVSEMLGVAHPLILGENLAQQLFAGFQIDAQQTVAVEVQQVEDVIMNGNVGSAERAGGAGRKRFRCAAASG